MRRLDAFSYYLQHASALPGFGGPGSAPDPRYCFHTHYEELQPGRTIFRLILTDAKASVGELTLRVHGYKPGPDSDITLVAGTRKLLAADGQVAATIELSVAFVALKGVQYALYGFFSEPSDLQVGDVEVIVEELHSDQTPFVEAAAPCSHFSNPSVISPDRLHADGEPSLHNPTSQDCTHSQLPGSRRTAASEADCRQWENAVALAALEQYGQLDANAQGHLIGDVDGSLATAISVRGGNVAHRDAGYDFIVCSGLEWPAASVDRYQFLQGMISNVLQGGLAIFFLRYAAHESQRSETHNIDRNEIGQWALRLIGAGNDVAQLAFAPSAQRVADNEGRTPFVFIVRTAVPD